MKLEEAIQSNKFRSQAQKAVLNVLYTAWWLRSISNQTLKQHQLTHEQYNVLRILNGKHPEAMCVKDIAARVIEKSSNVPRIIDRLTAKKWVKRSQGLTDRRETIISLTAAGSAVLTAATQKMETEMRQQIHLSEEDAVQLNSLLEALRSS